jgi:hypothetical protein
VPPLLLVRLEAEFLHDREEEVSVGFGLGVDQVGVPVGGFIEEVEVGAHEFSSIIDVADLSIAVLQLECFDVHTGEGEHLLAFLDDRDVDCTSSGVRAQSIEVSDADHVDLLANGGEVELLG